MDLALYVFYLKIYRGANFCTRILTTLSSNKNNISLLYKLYLRNLKSFELTQQNIKQLISLWNYLNTTLKYTVVSSLIKHKF